MLRRATGLWALILLAHASAQQEGQKNAKFDFFFLVREWGPTYCEEKSRVCDKSAFEAFTVHGLWPQYDDTGYPEDCGKRTGDKFDESVFSDAMLDELNCVWVSYVGSNWDFWRSEFEKHGTCAPPVLPSQEPYFEAALRLHERYSVEAALDSAGIDPRSGDPISSSMVAQAFKDAWGVSPILVCDSRGRLEEVRLCVGLDLEAIDCPAAYYKKQQPGDENSAWCEDSKKTVLPLAGRESAVPKGCQRYLYPNNNSTGGW